MEGEKVGDEKIVERGVEIVRQADRASEDSRWGDSPCRPAAGHHPRNRHTGPGDPNVLTSLHLLFNAAAHPQASFYGLDLNPTHIAEANAKAEALGLSNVHFALADLTAFAEGLPSTGPCGGWPESFDVVVAHGLANWVGPEVATPWRRQALADLGLHLGAAQADDADFMRALKATLTDRPESLG